MSGGSNGVEFSYSPGGGHVIQDNICYATSPGGVGCIEPNNTSKFTGKRNVIINPKFVNAGPVISGKPDFRLAADSPAINAGVNLFASDVKTDFKGTARPQSGPFEIGAYEFGGVVAGRQPSAPGDLQVQ